MQPIEHFEITVEIDALQRRQPRLENLEPAHRAVMPTLPRRLQARGPGGADAADEDQAGVTRRRHLDGEFAFADFTFSNHGFQSNEMFCAFITADHLLRSASMNSAMAETLRGRSAV